MRNGRVTKHSAHICYTQSFIVQEIFSMFHPLALIKIEYGSAIHFLEPLLQVTFIDGHFAAEFFNGDGFTYMFN